MQQRICDCWLRVGGCFCAMETDNDNRTEVNSRRDNKASEQLFCDRLHNKKQKS